MEALFIIVPIIVIILSIVAIVSPTTAWYLREGWKYKNVEPSDAALFMIRVGGVLGVLGGIVSIVISQRMFREMPVGFP